MTLDRHELIPTVAHCPILAVSGQRHGDSVHLHPRGELDVWSSPVLEAWLIEAERETTDIVVDLGDVTFIDASGVHALQRAADRASQAGRGFTIGNAPLNVHRVLQLTRTTHLLEPISAAFSPAKLERPARSPQPGEDPSHPDAPPRDRSDVPSTRPPVALTFEPSQP